MRLADQSRSEPVDCPYLRIGVTSHCNLECRYCPSSGQQSMRTRSAAGGDCGVSEAEPDVADQTLSDGDIVAIIKAATAAYSGLCKVRLTGGEPVERPGLTDLVAAIAEIEPITRVCMTTNATLLSNHVDHLIRAGLNSLNVRLWSLRLHRYEELTGGGILTDALAGLNAAQAAGLTDVHVTVPIVRGVNDDEIESFVNLAIWQSITVRFMEHGSEDIVTAEEIQTRILARHTLETISRPTLGGPARVYSVDRGAGRIELSTCLSRPPCWRCNRIDVSTDGILRSCPRRPFALDLKPLLERADSHESLRQAFADALAEKRQARPFARSGDSPDLTPMIRRQGRPVQPRLVTPLTSSSVVG